MFSGDFLLSPFSVNNSCYGSDGRLISQHFVHCRKIRAIFVGIILYCAEWRRKFYQCKSEHKPGTTFVHLVFMAAYFINAGHQR
jgi:hypothetical protein